MVSDSCETGFIDNECTSCIGLLATCSVRDIKNDISDPDIITEINENLTYKAIVIQSPSDKAITNRYSCLVMIPLYHFETSVGQGDELVLTRTDFRL